MLGVLLGMVMGCGSDAQTDGGTPATGGSLDAGAASGGAAGSGGASGASSGGSGGASDADGGQDGGAGGATKPDAGTGGGSGGGANPDGGGVPFAPCANSLDCSVGQICNRDRGVCVECVIDADCASAELCLSNRCRPECESDNTCTPLGMLCNRTVGHCADCAVDEDCAPSEVCGNGVCTDPNECVPTTCVAEGANCGSVLDGCGDALDCGTCTGPKTCGGAGIPNVCGDNSCTPTTCVAEGKNCGVIEDGCSGMLNCGTCGGSQTCGGASVANVCGSPNCTPTTCQAEGKNCGVLSDGCGEQLNCGACQAPDSCGGGGTANVCGCVARTECGAECGTLANGCGGTLDCGPCESGNCRSGRYEGPMEGTYESATLPGSILPVTGTISFRLVPQGGDLYAYSEGTFSGIVTSPVLGNVPFSGPITGQFDCSNPNPQGGAIDATVPVVGSITGTATARYDQATSSFVEGVWDVSEGGSTTYGGSGTWTANWIGN